jgi:hypothetical protein
MAIGLPVYSFIDTYADLAGPGGDIQLASGAGAAEEGITIEPIEDNVSTQYGADGSWSHSLNPVKAFRITARILKTSPTNALLDAMYALQKTSSLLTGQNFFHLRNISSGDVITASGVAFAKHPGNTYAKVAGMLDWEFIAGTLDSVLGAGVGVGA